MAESKESLSQAPEGDDIEGKAPDTHPSQTETPSNPRLRSSVWTLSGAPVVDGRYISPTTHTLCTVTPSTDLVAGPPAIEVRWFNVDVTGSDKDDHSWFGCRSFSAFVDVTEYLTRIGKLLALGGIQVWNLSATKYAVYVVVATRLTRWEMNERFEKTGVFPALPDTGDLDDKTVLEK